MYRRDIVATTLGMLSIGLSGCASSAPENETASSDDDLAEQSPTTISENTDTSSESPPTTPSQTTDTPSSDPPSTQTPPCGGPPHPYLTTPDGFHIEPYADSEALGGGTFSPGPEPGPRMLATYRGTLYATIPSQSRVVAFPEEGQSGSPARVVTVVEDLAKPHGIVFHDDRLYLALADALVRYEMDGLTTATSKEVLVDDIPRGKYHWTRTIATDGSRLYLSAGACTSGACSGGDDGYLGTITAVDLDGSDPTTYATGLRNAVGLEWHDGSLFATENGIDDLGPNRPPDEINVIKQGHDYGYPACYGDNVPVPNDSTDSDCENSTPPVVMLQAHVAPLGFGFAPTTAFPIAHQGDMYVALHGSWTREEPVGYKILHVPYSNGTLGTPQDFVTGWMPEGGTNDDARGRPVDVLFNDGVMYVSDDMTGEIYRICHNGSNTDQ